MKSLLATIGLAVLVAAVVLGFVIAIYLGTDKP